MGAFWSEFNKSYDEGLTQALGQLVQSGKLKGSLASPVRHPEFYRSVEDLAKKAGLEYVPRVLISETVPIGPAWARKLPNAAASPLVRLVIVGKPMMELTNASLSRPMSPELKSFMAHEFSHLKDGVLYSTGWQRLSPLTSPFIAMAGLALYDHITANTKKKPDESPEEYQERVTSNIHQSADEEIKKIEETKSDTPHKWEIDPQSKKGFVNGMRYIAAAAVGLGAGLMLTRHKMLSAEYRADKMAVEWAEAPEAQKKTLSNLHKIWGEAGRKQPPADTFAKKWNEFYHEKISANTIHAHPTLEQRLSFIDQVAKERLLNPASQQNRQ